MEWCEVGIGKWRRISIHRIAADRTGDPVHLNGFTASRAELQSDGMHLCSRSTVETGVKDRSRFFEPISLTVQPADQPQAMPYQR